jgi:hypothetical protein
MPKAISGNNRDPVTKQTTLSTFSERKEFATRAKKRFRQLVNIQEDDDKVDNKRLGLLL